MSENKSEPVIQKNDEDHEAKKKRGADRQISSQDGDQDNFIQEQDEGPWKPADANTLAKRRIVKARRRVPKAGNAQLPKPSFQFNFGAPAAPAATSTVAATSVAATQASPSAAATKKSPAPSPAKSESSATGAVPSITPQQSPAPSPNKRKVEESPQGSKKPRPTPPSTPDEKKEGTATEEPKQEEKKPAQFKFDFTKGFSFGSTSTSPSSTSTPSFSFGSSSSSPSTSTFSFMPPPSTPSPSKEDGKDKVFGANIPAPLADPDKAIGGLTANGSSSTPIKLSDEPVITGEEDETTNFQGRVKLFGLDKEKKTWRESGVGTLKVNVDKEKRARLVMRRDGTHTVILNVLLFPSVQCESVNAKNIKIVCAMDDTVSNFLLRVGQVDLGAELLAAIVKAKDEAPMPTAKKADVDKKDDQKKEEGKEEKKEDKKE